MALRLNETAIKALKRTGAPARLGKLRRNSTIHRRSDWGSEESWACPPHCIIVLSPLHRIVL